MIANNSFYLILEDDFFINLCRSLKLNIVFCNENLFVFNDKFSFIVSDSINDFDMEYIFYNRHEKNYVYGIYAILQIIKDASVGFKFTNKEYEQIDFEKIKISIIDKKKSFNVFLSIIEFFGETIFANGLNTNDDVFTKAIDLVSKKWESCMIDINRK